MRLLDRYIAGKFLYILLLSLVAFIGIFIFGDTFEQLDKFVDKKATIGLIIKYYVYYIPFIVVLTLPVAMLLSSLFSIGQMAKYNELTAMRASGISLYRTLIPLFVIGLGISGITLIWAEYVVPYANARKAAIFNYEIKKKTRGRRVVKRDVYVQDADNCILFVKTYDSKLNRGTKVSFSRITDNRLVSVVNADQMVWQDGSWLLKDGIRRMFEGTAEHAVAFDTLSFTSSGIRPADIVRRKKSPDEMNYFELKSFIGRVRQSGQDPTRWLVDLHLKIAFPLANFIIVLFGAPLMANRVRGGTTGGVGMSLFITFFYYGIIRAGQSLGYNGTLPPALAAWLGNAVFGGTGLFILFKVPK